MLNILMTVTPNMGEQLFVNIIDQIWGWAFTESGGRIAGAMVILGLFFKLFEILLLRLISKVKKNSKQTKRQARK